MRAAFGMVTLQFLKSPRTCDEGSMILRGINRAIDDTSSASHIRGVMPQIQKQAIAVNSTDNPATAAMTCT
jgi:hypothetical protein